MGSRGRIATANMATETLSRKERRWLRQSEVSSYFESSDDEDEPHERSEGWVSQPMGGFDGRDTAVNFAPRTKRKMRRRTGSTETKSAVQWVSIWDLEAVDDEDITLVLENERVEIRTSSVVLCRISPVFERMLGPSSYFAEGDTTRIANDGTRHVCLPDDVFLAMGLILRVAHGVKQSHFNRLTTFEVLFQIAILCDKYDMCDTIKAWACEELECTWTRNASIEQDYRSLFVSWILGYTKLFATVSHFVVLNSGLSASGDLSLKGITGQGIPVPILGQELVFIPV